MRGLLQASLLLAPALASALVVPDVDIGDFEIDRVITDQKLAFQANNFPAKNFPQDHSFALIGVEIPASSPDEHARDALAFRLDVFPSEEACGYGTVTVDGQLLPQIVDGGVATGKGSVTTDRKNIIGASWSFQCIKINGQPDSQFLKFTVDVIDGKTTEDVGFSALFRQTGSTEIINIETDLSLPDHVIANPSPERLRPVSDEDHEFPQFSIEQEMGELHWIRAQLKELEYLIWRKEQAIHQQAHAHSKEEIQDCDSLKCFANAVVDRARKAAYKAINKIHGDNGDHSHHDLDEEDFHYFPKWPFKKPHWPKKPGNCSLGKPPKQGSNTALPHWKKPPHKPLPICRYPPPTKKSGPHHKPIDHPPPPPGEKSSPTPPPHHEYSPHEGSPHSYHGLPDHEMGPAHTGYRGPWSEEMRPHGHHGGPEHDGPPHKGHDDHHGAPGTDRPCYGPHRGPGHDEIKFDHPPPHQPGFEPEAPLNLFGDERRPPGPPSHRPFDGPGPQPHVLGKTFHIIKFVIIGVLLSFLVIALHRRNCNPKNRAERKARKEEHRRRRAFRRAAHKHAIARFFSRMTSGYTDDGGEDYEEKRMALLASAAEDGMSTTMTEEITEFRNAAEVVDDMFTARAQPQFQPIAIPASVSSSASANGALMRDYDIGSQVGDIEELPAYEDNDGSEMSSVVADGFRYTPGSTEYSPSHSPAGSVSDILGPHTKQ